MARKEQAATSSSEEDEEEFTLPEDLEIKTVIKEILGKLGKIQLTNEEVRDRAKTLGGGESKELQEQIREYEAELKTLRMSEENHKEILTTLRQQTELLNR